MGNYIIFKRSSPKAGFFFGGLSGGDSCLNFDPHGLRHTVDDMQCNHHIKIYTLYTQPSNDNPSDQHT